MHLWATQSSSPSWELELRPLGVATGNASSVTRVWRYICKNTIRWPATAHDVTTGATIIKGSPGEYIISFFVFTDWSVWRNVHSGRNTVFLYLSWRALARRSRSVWIRVFVIWHPMTHTIVASFVWAKSTHAMSLRGQYACTMSFLYEKAPFSSVPLFEERGAAVCFPRFGTHRCRGTEAIEIAGFAVGYGRWVEKDRPFSRASAENESELLDCDDAIFLTSSDSAVSALLGYAQEEQEMFEGEEVETEPSQSSCTAYEWVFGGYGS